MRLPLPFDVSDGIIRAQEPSCPAEAPLMRQLTPQWNQFSTAGWSAHDAFASDGDDLYAWNDFAQGCNQLSLAMGRGLVQNCLQVVADGDLADTVFCSIVRNARSS